MAVRDMAGYMRARRRRQRLAGTPRPARVSNGVRLSEPTARISPTDNPELVDTPALRALKRRLAGASEPALRQRLQRAVDYLVDLHRPRPPKPPRPEPTRDEGANVHVDASTMAVGQRVALRGGAEVAGHDPSRDAATILNASIRAGRLNRAIRARAGATAG